MKIKLIIIFFILNIFQSNMVYSATDQAKIKQDNGYFYNNYKSIMFNKRDIDDISNVLMNVKNKNRTINNETLSDTNVENNISDAGQTVFYLNSILYISNNYWTVWLNETKITNEINGDSNIKVLRLSPLKADFAWNFGLSIWDLINPNKIIPESMYEIKDNKVTLYFSLRPNQTFIPKENKVIEGRISEEPKLQDKTIQQPSVQDKNGSEEQNQKPEDNIFL